MKTYLDFLEEKLQPKYVGWKDQYKAILYALGINPDDDCNKYTIVRESEEI